MIARRLSSILFCVSLGFYSVVAAQEAGVEKKADDVRTSVVTGRVTYQDTNLPATRFRVMLVSNEVLTNPRASRRFPTAMTNDNGEFNLRKVPAGDYFVVATSIDDHSREASRVYPRPTGNAATDAEELKTFIKTRPRISVDGLQNREVNLQVPNLHFAVISGRVLDSSGKPAVRAFVRLMNRERKGGGGSTETDENGQYKFFVQVYGDYTLCASPPKPDSTTTTERRPRFEGELGLTCYPSTLDQANSPPITLVADQSRENIDVTLISRTLFSVAGTVVIRGSGQPVADAVVFLSQKKSTGTPYLSYADKNGKWSVANLINGDYYVKIQPNYSNARAQRFVEEQLDLSINGGDLQNLSIEVAEGGSISGTVTFEGDEPQSVNIHALRRQPLANSHATVTQSGPFVVPSVPAGDVEVEARVIPQEKFYVKSIHANGQDLQRTTMKTIEGVETKNVQIVVSSRVGVVTGRVVSAGSQPLARVNVMLRRVGQDRVRQFGGRLVSVTDEKGAFMLSGPPGNYLVVAWRTADGPGALSVSMKRAEQEQPNGIRLGENEKKEIEIRLP